MSHSLNPPHAPQAGAIQGIIIALTAFLPILAIVSLAPAVPTLIQHFAGVPYVETLVPLMLTAPGLVIAIAGPCTGWLAERHAAVWHLRHNAALHHLPDRHLLQPPRRRTGGGGSADHR